MPLIGPHGLVTRAIQEVDSALERTSRTMYESGDEVPAEVVKRAELQSYVWGPAFEATERISQSYGYAQSVETQTLLKMREDLVRLAEALKKADADIERVDSEVAHASERVVERIQHVGQQSLAAQARTSAQHEIRQQQDAAQGSGEG